MELLNPETFFFDLPLYTKIEIDKESEDDFRALINFCGKIDGYNPELRENSTYNVRVENGFGSRDRHPIHYYKRISKAELKCVRIDFTISVFIEVFSTESEDEDDESRYFVRKIGQSPSVADLHISKIRQYDKILKKPRLKEFTKAIGLAANGVGIGSFVYLRRIFEDLIYEAFQLAKSRGDVKDADYAQIRMDQRIELLKAHLPTFLVKNKEVYGILSKGIHELEEDECLQYFDAVKLGIEMILDEKVQQQAKQKKIAEAEHRLQIVSQSIKRPR